MDLNALREFSAVIAEGSFAAAGRRLGTPKSTVSKRIQDLEAALGVRLIERSTRKLRLTAEGALVLSRAERILADAGEIAAALGLARDAVAGHLRIAAPSLLAQSHLGRIAAELRHRHPEVTLELVATDGRPDLAEEGFDGAVRIGPLPEGQAGWEVARLDHVAVAAPGLAPPPPDPAGLTELPALLPGPGLIQTWHLTDGSVTRAVRVRGGLAITAPTALRDAALAGAGIALLPRWLVAGELAAGRLADMAPGWATPPDPVVFLCPEPASLSRRLRAFGDILGEVLGEG